jgi:hypothetical protein
MENILDLSEMLTEKAIKDMIVSFDDMTAEEKMILFEEYSEKYRNKVKYEDVRRKVC